QGSRGEALGEQGRGVRRGGERRDVRQQQRSFVNRWTIVRQPFDRRSASVRRADVQQQASDE
uniref:Uncharacterized protein n=1 Tax=Cucumis melo TaxID=3656 RepID=A0A9I9CC74_CUCME